LSNLNDIFSYPASCDSPEPTKFKPKFVSKPPTVIVAVAVPICVKSQVPPQLAESEMLYLIDKLPFEITQPASAHCVAPLTLFVVAQTKPVTGKVGVGVGVLVAVGVGVGVAVGGIGVGVGVAVGGIGVGVGVFVAVGVGVDVLVAVGVGVGVTSYVTNEAVPPEKSQQWSQ
jgi:hypothetical protein